MISPAEQKIIQVDITNACQDKCGSCTRFVGHHKKPYFVDVAHFEKAILSLEDYPKMVGVMGGEPTLHPKFEDIVKIISDLRTDERPLAKERLQPHTRFVDYRNVHLADLHWKKGLWSRLGERYYKHYELIQDTFGYQCINDHMHDGEHISLLLPRKELGIPDKEWIELRDNCWLQREWSAVVTPHGAYYCEVAGNIDLTFFGGKSAWKVEKNWWQRTPKEFADQIHLCEYCSACLAVPRVKANEELEFVSPEIKKLMESIQSPKLKQHQVEVFDPSKYLASKYKINTSDSEVYMPDDSGKNSVRVAATNVSIKPKKLDIVIVCVGYDDYLNITLPYAVANSDACYVVTTKDDTKTADVVLEHGARLIISDRLKEAGAPFAKGKGINDALEQIKPTDWVLVMDADILLHKAFKKNLFSKIINPGVLYYTRRWGARDYRQLPNFLEDFRNEFSWEELFKLYANKRQASFEGRYGNDLECFPFGYFQLFNVNSKALRGRRKIYPEESSTAEHDDKNFGTMVYPEEKRVCLPLPEFDVIHLPHGRFQENWRGRQSPRIENIEKIPKELLEKISIEYRCVKACQYRGRLWKQGEILTTEAEDVPRHFERQTALVQRFGS